MAALRTILRFSVLYITIAIILIFDGLSHAQDAAGGDLSPDKADYHNTKIIEDFLIETLTPLVANGSIPGAVFTIVEGDQITALRGLGHADIEQAEEIDPRNTLMRIGSITKSFTALAIHQLIEDNQVELDKDANNYLTTEKISSTFKSPVTVRHLLSHQAGFDGNLSFISTTENNETDIEQGWVSRQLIRLRPAGDVFAYDNSAYAALGQILVDYYDKPYSQVIEDQLFKPMGMRKSVVGVPDSHADKVAQCYNRAGGNLGVCKHQLLKKTYQAAGDISATAEDMGKFLIALLNDGDADGNHVLGNAQFKKFSTTASRLHPLGPGVGLGAYETGAPGFGVFGHSGGIRGGSSMYAVMPESNVAVFVSINASLSTEIITTLSGMFALATAPSVPDNFDPGDLTTFDFPAKIPALFHDVSTAQVSDVTTCPIENLAGNYQYLRPMMFSSLAIRFVGPLALSPVVVEQLDDGSWQIEDKGPYDEIAPCHFKLRDTSYADGEIATLVSFTTTPEGEIVGGAHPLAAWIKLPWHAAPMVSVFPYPTSILLLIGLGAIGSLFAHKSKISYQFALAGAVLLLIGLGLEMQYETPLHQYDGQLAPMLGWRIILNIGLALIAFSIFQAGKTVIAPTSSALTRAPLSALIAAGTVAILLSAYWGVLGNFVG